MKLIRLIVFLGFSFTTVTVSANGTAEVLKQSEFKAGYLKICDELLKQKVEFCTCMENAYSSRGYNSKDELKAIEKMYTVLSDEKSTDEDIRKLDSTLTTFDADASETCLSKVSKEPKAAKKNKTEKAKP